MHIWTNWSNTLSVFIIWKLTTQRFTLLKGKEEYIRLPDYLCMCFSPRPTVSGEWGIRSDESVKLLLLWPHHGWWPHTRSAPFACTSTQCTQGWAWSIKPGVRALNTSGVMYICFKWIIIKVVLYVNWLVLMCNCYTFSFFPEM